MKYKIFLVLKIVGIILYLDFLIGQYKLIMIEKIMPLDIFSIIDTLIIILWIFFISKSAYKTFKKIRTN